MRLILKFADALTDTVTVIVYVEFQNVIEMDSNRKRSLRLFDMNAYQIDGVICQHMRRFDGIFACDRLPTKPRLLVVQEH